MKSLGTMRGAIKGLVLSLALISPCAWAAHQPPGSMRPRLEQARAGHKPRTLLGQLAQAPRLFVAPARTSESPRAPLGLTLVARLPLRRPAPSFAIYTARVRQDLLVFQSIPIDLNPPIRQGRALIERPQSGFWRAPPTDDLLAVYRQRDRLIYFRDMPLDGSHLAMGLGMFAAAALLSAHAPRPLRILFDRSFHLGPAIFDRSGMGVGFGGQFP